MTAFSNSALDGTTATFLILQALMMLELPQFCHNCLIRLDIYMR